MTPTRYTDATKQQTVYCCVILSSSLSKEVHTGDLLVAVNGRRVLDNEESVSVQGHAESEKYFDEVLGVIGKVPKGTSKVTPLVPAPYRLSPYIIPTCVLQICLSHYLLLSPNLIVFYHILPRSVG